MSAVVMRRKSNRWQRETMVSGSLWTSVVAKKNFTWGGGSSSVLRSVLNASRVSMWASSMM
jgi:formiminotetrahydrofolate cyclodeaminase